MAAVVNNGGLPNECCPSGSGGGFTEKQSIVFSPAPQPIPDSTSTFVIMDNPLVTDGAVTFVPPFFLAATANGLYVLSVGVTWDSAVSFAGNRELNVVSSNAQLFAYSLVPGLPGAPIGSTQQIQQVSAPVRLITGDLIGISVSQNSGAPLPLLSAVMNIHQLT